MSIAKNTRARKKVPRQNAGPAVPAKQQAKLRFQAQSAEKYPNLGAVHEADLRQFVSTVPISHLVVYGARFQAVREALEAARQQPSARTKQAVARLIADLEKESQNRRYRRILQALAAAAAKSDKGLNRAYWTALRVIEMTFEWTSEYMFAFGLYEQRLKALRRAGGTTPAAR